MTNEVDVSYNKRVARVPEVTKLHDGSFRVAMEGYEDRRAEDLEDLERHLEDLWQFEQVRLSYKKGA